MVQAVGQEEQRLGVAACVLVLLDVVEQQDRGASVVFERIEHLGVDQPVLGELLLGGGLRLVAYGEQVGVALQVGDPGAQLVHRYAERRSSREQQQQQQAHSPGEPPHQRSSLARAVPLQQGSVGHLLSPFLLLPTE